MRDTEYSMHCRLPGIAFDEALERTAAALKNEGFGVLTRIDVDPRGMQPCPGERSPLRR
jgi:hypothetical protein